jgi:hypothetical protein
MKKSLGSRTWIVVLIVLLSSFAFGPAYSPAYGGTSTVTMGWTYDNAANPTVTGFNAYRYQGTEKPTDAQIRAVTPLPISDKLARSFTDVGVPNGHVWYVLTATDGTVESASSNMVDTPLNAANEAPGNLVIKTVTTTTVTTETTVK